MAGLEEGFYWALDLREPDAEWETVFIDPRYSPAHVFMTGVLGVSREDDFKIGPRLTPPTKDAEGITPNP